MTSNGNSFGNGASLGGKETEREMPLWRRLQAPAGARS